VDGRVQPLLFLLLGHTEPDAEINRERQHQGHAKRPAKRKEDAANLRRELEPTLVKIGKDGWDESD
jgi:hypothetical protein